MSAGGSGRDSVRIICPGRDQDDLHAARTLTLHSIPRRAVRSDGRSGELGSILILVGRGPRILLPLN